MKKITLTLKGKDYEFAYSKDFRILKKREDEGTEFYSFGRFAYWNPTGKKALGKADVVLMIKGNTFMKTEIEVGDLVNVRKSAFTPHLKHVMKVYGIKIKRKGHKVTKIYSPSIYGSTAYVIDNGKMVLFDDDVE